MCERTEAANQIREAAQCLTEACFNTKSYRDHLDDTLREGVPDWARELLDKLK
jgi:hypothetical protein